jgi:hypothetical protein
MKRIRGKVKGAQLSGRLNTTTLQNEVDALFGSWNVGFTVRRDKGSGNIVEVVFEADEKNSEDVPLDRKALANVISAHQVPQGQDTDEEEMVKIKQRDTEIKQALSNLPQILSNINDRLTALESK